jgi:AraC-like DNA-binding protein
MPERPPSYSLKLARPFVRVLKRRGLPIEALHAFEGGRVELALGLALLAQLPGAAELAVEAGLAIEPGECGALDYALASAGTLREAIAIAGEYMPVVSDVLIVRLEEEGERACMFMDTPMPLHEAARDFGMVSFYTSHVRHWIPAPQLEVWLARTAPADPAALIAAFAPHPVRFSAPRAAFAFPRALLDAPRAGSDPRLHAALMDEVRALAREMPPAAALSAAVCALLEAALPAGQGDVVGAAAALGLSTRTLHRRLAREGTSFSDLLDYVRRRLALSLLAEQQLSVAEVARRTGFSDVPTFHRAFKRWARETPGSYRSRPIRQGST